VTAKGAENLTPDFAIHVFFATHERSPERVPPRPREHGSGSPPLHAAVVWGIKVEAVALNGSRLHGRL